ncbi:ABC transporter ATP-binding protein [Rubinisphaera margarita]|uniref:ABC transporter ATP-binding protein n=1 Tax=Rubinisphaera margarita TaxID=2909586 RepID=UPI001EE7CF1E|nr:ABC transporter ATP-binding protein [Rubinisphaera margarita]MCG6157326.1 ABC transporter ATP-binding protein [Rubinisphaera margarita]
MSDVVIRAEGLGKQFRIGKKQPYSRLSEVLMGWLTAPFRQSRDGDSSSETTFWALRDVDFEVHRGDVVGIIGRNGAGKSTLLKVLSRITEPTSGRFGIKGRVGSLLEVGTGFHQELTGRENIYLSGTVLGMQRHEIAAQFDEIVAFAGLEKFLDTPVKRYSSGMQVRLGFAVAAHLQPEILIVDEVLAVGDAEFQRKCLQKISDVAHSGHTILIVSHSMISIQRLCNKCLWLEDGTSTMYDDVNAAVDKYLTSFWPAADQTYREFELDESKPVQLARISLHNQNGDPAISFSCDEPIGIDMEFEVRRDIAGVYGYLELVRADGLTVLVSDSQDLASNPFATLQPGRRTIRMTVPPRVLGHGEYSVYLSLASRREETFQVDLPGNTLAFRVSDLLTARGDNRGGVVSTLLEWKPIDL